MNKLLIGVVGSIVIAASLLFWNYERQISNLESDLEHQVEVSQRLETSNREYQETLSRIEENMEAIQQERQRLRQNNERILQEQREAKQQLEEALGRQETVRQRPTLVQNMINTSYIDFSDKFACITGAREKCE